MWCDRHMTVRNIRDVDGLTQQRHLCRRLAMVRAPALTPSSATKPGEV